MAYPDKINALVDVTADQTLAAGGHAARHNDVNDALDELEAVFTAPAANELALRPDGSTERVRLTSGGSVLIGTTSGGSAGAGDLVVNGGVFLGGSAAANELDDYEEGTWTPEFLFATNMTYTSQTGTYTKIGRLVFVRGKIDVASHTQPDASAVRIGGLPFTVTQSGPEAALFTLGEETDFLGTKSRELRSVRYFQGNSFILSEDDYLDSITYTECAASGTLTFSAMYELF